MLFIYPPLKEAEVTWLVISVWFHYTNALTVIFQVQYFGWVHFPIQPPLSSFPFCLGTHPQNQNATKLQKVFFPLRNTAVVLVSLLLMSFTLSSDNQQESLTVRTKQTSSVKTISEGGEEKGKRAARPSCSLQLNISRLSIASSINFPTDAFTET